MCGNLKGNETRPLLLEIDTPAKAGDKIALNIVGPMVESHKGYNYFHLSGFVNEVGLCRNCTTKRNNIRESS